VTNIFDTYGEAFQFNVVQAVINSPQFFRAIKDYLKPDFFTGEHAQGLYQIIVDFYNENHVVPRYDTIEYLIRSRYHKDEWTRDVILKYLYILQKKPVFKDEDYVKTKTVNFCKRQAAIDAVDKSLKLIEVYGTNIEIEPDFTEIFNLFKSVLDINVDSIDSDIMENIMEFYQQDNIRKNVRSSGWRFYDYLLDGGAGAGDVITIAGASGVGKTTACINIGSNAFMRGETVFHATFENAKAYNARRYQSCITGIPIRNLFERKAEIQPIINKYTGHLHVKEYQMGKFTVNALETYHNRLLDEGIKPDIIIVDSPLHLKSTVRQTEKRDQIGDTWKEIKGWAQSIETPIFVTAQLNRHAFGEKTNGGETMGDSIDIYRDSDAVLTIGRDVKDSLEGVAYFHNAKSRFGPDKQEWKVNWDNSTCKITEDIASTESMMQQLLKQEASGSNRLDKEKT